MPKLTKPQQTALARLVARDKDASRSPAWPNYRTARKAVHVGYDCIMIFWCGMWLGIEKDGYTHS
jgi:hypothetical protein